MEKKKSLSLDELFGEEQSITVIWKKEVYRLKNPSSFSPIELHEWERLRKVSSSLNELEGGDMSDSQAQELEDAVKRSVELLNKGLGKKDIPFFARVKILEFYAEQVAGDKGEGSKKKET